MDYKSVDRVVNVLCLLLLLLALASLFSACGQVRYVATTSQHMDKEVVVRHDTIEVTKVFRERVVEKVKDSVAVVLDDSGKVKNRDRLIERYLFIENKDSVNYYRSLADSLLSMVVDSIQEPVIVEKELSGWTQWRIRFGDLSMFACGLFALFLLIRFKMK